MDDWEMLHGSDTESIDSITSVKNSGSSSLIDDGMIVSDHFSAENLSQFGVIESGDCDSDSSRVDYGSDRRENQVADLGFDQFGVYDSKSGTLDDGEVKLSDFEADDVAEVNGGNLSHDGDASKCLFESDNIEVVDNGRNVESESGVEEPIEDSSKCFSESDDVEEVDNLRHVESLSGVEEPIEDLGKSWSDSGGNELVSGDSGSVNGEEEVVSDSVVASTEAIEGNGAVRCGDEGKSREIVWWKMPFVLLKYYTFRIGPVWSVSMAAAVMGLVLLGRRLYNMKKKAQRFHLKVTIDDKKASRVMSQAARLNEVFTEVRRVPVIRPALPSPGAWPVLSLR